MRVPHGEIGPPDEVPAARGVGRVDAGLAPGDRHAPRGHAEARRWSSGERELLRDEPEVGEARRESDAEDPVLGSCMEPDDVVLRVSGPRRNLGEIGPGCAAVADRHLDDGQGIDGRVRLEGCAERLGDHSSNHGLIEHGWVEWDEDARVGGNRRTEPGHPGRPDVEPE